MNNAFYIEYKRFVNKSVNNDFADNYDYDRYGSNDSMQWVFSWCKFKSLNDLKNVYKFIKSRIRAVIRKNLACYLGLCNEASVAERWAKPNIKRFQWLYDQLADEESRNLLIYLLAYRALGYRRVKLPLNTPEYWAVREQVRQMQRESEGLETGFLGWKVYSTDLRPLGYPYKLFGRGIQSQFCLQQYRCVLECSSIEAVLNDVVIDAGGCYGDTALYFSGKVGPTGRVYSFEFMPDNVAIFNKNLQLNPEYAKIITLVQSPLWSKAGEELYIEGHGPGASVKQFSNDPSSRKIKTLSIDFFVKQHQLDRLNFIKMDIEGAELSALRGAEQSIRRFRPKLAISVYHRLKDFWEIPEWIHSLGLGYIFHLRHFTIHQEETVLFAQAN